MTKGTVGQSIRISIKQLKADGFFKPYKVARSYYWRYGQEDPYACVNVELSEDNREARFSLPREPSIAYVADYFYRVNLKVQACHYGGVRYWFVCPSCFRSCGVVYLRYGRCACRRCLNLCYASQKLGRLDRLIGVHGYFCKLDDERASMRITHYAGKPTKRYALYSKRAERTWNMMVWLERRLFV